MITEHLCNITAIRAGNSYAAADAYVECLAKAIVKIYAYAYAYAIAAADCYGDHQSASADAIISAYVEADFSTTEKCYANVDTVAVGRACATAFTSGTTGAVRIQSQGCPCEFALRKCTHAR
jgi:hypothetical protein